MLEMMQSGQSIPEQDNLENENKVSKPTDAEITDRVKRFLQDPQWLSETIAQLREIQAMLSAVEAGKRNLKELETRLAQIDEIEDFDERFDAEEALRDETELPHIRDILGLYRDYYMGWTSEDFKKALNELNRR